MDQIPYKASPWRIPVLTAADTPETALKAPPVGIIAGQKVLPTEWPTISSARISKKKAHQSAKSAIPEASSPLKDVSPTHNFRASAPISESCRSAMTFADVVKKVSIRRESPYAQSPPRTPQQSPERVCHRAMVDVSQCRFQSKDTSAAYKQDSIPKLEEGQLTAAAKSCSPLASASRITNVQEQRNGRNRAITFSSPEQEAYYCEVQKQAMTSLEEQGMSSIYLSFPLKGVS